MTTLDRHVASETLRGVVAGVVVFVGLVLVRRGYNVIEIVLSRDLGLGAGAGLLGLALPGALAYALPMAGLFAAVATFNRMRADREAVAAFAAGVAPVRLARPALPVGLALAVAAFFVSAVWDPAATEAVESGAWLRSADPLAALPEGAVGRIGDRTIWAGRVDAKGRRLERVLIATVEEGRHLTFIAPRGRWDLDEGAVRIEIEDGSIVERDAEGRTHRLRFEVYEARLPLESAEDGGRYARRATFVEVAARIDRPEYAYELQRRLAAPIASLAFFLLGPPLGLAVGRTGRTASFAVCAAVFVGHYVASGALENAIAAGTLPAWTVQTPSVLLGAAGVVLMRRVGRPA